MNEPTSFDELDQLLRQTLRARPEIHAPSNLAAVAMAKAKSADLVMAKFARVQRLNRWFTALAAMVIIGVSVWIVHSRLDAGGFQLWGVSDNTVSATASDSSTTTSTTALDWMLAGTGMALAAVVIVAGQRALSSADEVRWGTIQFKT